MPIYEIIVIALALAMDAFAVAIATCVAKARVGTRQVFRLSFHFGLFQALMPVAGWAAGLSFARFIASWDHWLAFALLAIVGGKMMMGAVRAGGGSARNGDAPARGSADPTRGWSLVALSLATSVDALAVGLSFAMLNVGIFAPVLIIGVTAAALTVAGMALGSRLGAAFGRSLGNWTEAAGGLILIAIGVKIVVEHLGAR